MLAQRLSLALKINMLWRRMLCRLAVVQMHDNRFSNSLYKVQAFYRMLGSSAFPSNDTARQRRRLLGAALQLRGSPTTAGSLTGGRQLFRGFGFIGSEAPVHVALALELTAVELDPKVAVISNTYGMRTLAIFDI